MDHLVLTIIAADKPGLVERIAQNIAAHGGNWLESRMAHMAGQFAGILRVSVPAENRQALVNALEDHPHTASVCWWARAAPRRRQRPNRSP